MNELYTDFGQYFPKKFVFVTLPSLTSFCFELLTTCGLKKTDFKIGKTEVFLRLGKLAQLDQILSVPDTIKSIRKEKVKAKWRQVIKRSLVRFRCTLPADVLNWLFSFIL